MSTIPKNYISVNNALRVLALLALCVLIPATALGHSLYIQSSRYLVDEGKRSPLFFCYGHHIPVDDGLRPKKLKAVRVHSPAGDVKEVEIRDATGLHSYMMDYDVPGTYVLSAETNPGYYTAYIDKKGRERHTIKPKSAIVEKAQSISTSLFSKQFTKTYVICEKPSETFPDRVGLTLELVPTKDISQLKPGEDLVLKVYFNGRLYTGKGVWDATYNGFSTVAEDNFYTKTEVTGDTIRIPVPNAGRWFVRYFIKIDATGKDLEQYTQMKYTSTLVFQISNERKRPKNSSH